MNYNKRNTAVVLNIERYAIEDGPGIRTLVFLKGCPLRCEWCANPESQIKRPQLIYYRSECAGCMRCVIQCPYNAIKNDSEFGLVADVARCTACGICTDVCYYGAREVLGKRMTISEVMEVIEKDKMFYDLSGGGVTISGGEPLIYPGFVNELTRECRVKGIHTAVETSLSISKQRILKSLQYADLIFADIKHIDSQVHRNHTGADNERILENITLVDSLGIPLIIRIPFIPGFNDDVTVLEEIFFRASKIKNLQWVEILPYHRLALGKYAGLGRDYKLKALRPVKKGDLTYLQEVGGKIGVEVRIGAT